MSGINIHEFLKFFSLQFPTKNIEIAFKVCNFLFAHHPPPISTLKEEKMPNYRFLKSPKLLPSHFILLSPFLPALAGHKKAHYIICTDSHYQTRTVLLDLGGDFCDRPHTHLQTRGASANTSGGNLDWMEKGNLLRDKNCGQRRAAGNNHWEILLR